MFMRLTFDTYDMKTICSCNSLCRHSIESERTPKW